MLGHGLVRIDGRGDISLLMEYLDDPDLIAQTAIALGELKAEDARLKLKSVSHADPWVEAQIREAPDRVELNALSRGSIAPRAGKFPWPRKKRFSLVKRGRVVASSGQELPLKTQGPMLEGSLQSPNGRTDIQVV